MVQSPELNLTVRPWKIPSPTGQPNRPGGVADNGHQADTDMTVTDCAMTVAIVGNAPDMADLSSEIDACNMVVRFNNAPGLGRWDGKRVTHLALVNRGGQPQEWVKDNGFDSMIALRSASEVIFPFPLLQDGPSGLCWTQEMTLALAPFDLRPRTLDEDIHDAAREALRAFGAIDPICPSTGYLVAFDLLRRHPDWTIAIYGFGFTGWPLHPWSAEHSWFQEQHRRGALELKPLR